MAKGERGRRRKIEKKENIEGAEKEREEMSTIFVWLKHINY